MTKLDCFNSSMLLAPTRNIAILSESLNLSINLFNCSCEAEFFRNGNAMPTASAPRAIALAASSHVLMPPDEMTGTSTAFTTSTVLAAVGIPQSQNISPRYLSSARYVSTAAQLVPPAPSISM